MPIHLSIFALEDSSATFVSINASELHASNKFVQCGAHIQPLSIRFVAEAALVTYLDYTSFAKNCIFTRVALLWFLIWGQYRVADSALDNLDKRSGCLIYIGVLISFF